MKIFPSCEVKMLSECSSGKLVRLLNFGQSDSYSIVCKSPNAGKVGVVWIDTNMVQFDEYEDADTLSVLEYNGDLVWEIDQQGPFEPPIRDIFEMSGSIVVTKDASYLNVIRSNSVPSTKLQLKISEGFVGPYREPMRDAAIFGSWKLFLEDAHRPIENRTKIAEFCVKAGD